ncbi:D12 class N6 adenine-specific DNA methyltransferase (plasmid) [Thioalkalivibrio sp. K90mix]|uniref:DNA adenine methylase n=1 Tax=Thioalkalivibrio sp. (strain K90mix) TaxID=396595 RepID=UPI000195A56A|nr:DNA adenine methylase [Thioalkalivibrio sp. K90mix]ADC73232.1 D12 class N6 adenine-specific DNA methyltransferase [Thioalkalivibrio sp. K90mix]
MASNPACFLETASPAACRASDPPSNPLMRYYGAKWRLAPWVLEHFPPHRIYVEPFGGAAGVLLQKSQAELDVYNDLDDEVVNVFRVLRDPEEGDALRRACHLTPYSRAEFECSFETVDDPVERARRTLFRAWSSHGSTGATRTGRSGFRGDSGHPGTNPAHQWARLAEVLPAFIERMKGVLVENRDGLDVMRLYDAPDTLHYLDPPYLPGTLHYDGGRYYRHNLSEPDHERLLEVARSMEGRVVISGYPNPLYDALLSDWTRVTRSVAAAGASGSDARTECLWLNPAVIRSGRQPSLFGANHP